MPPPAPREKSPIRPQTTKARASENDVSRDCFAGANGHRPKIQVQNFQDRATTPTRTNTGKAIAARSSSHQRATTHMKRAWEFNLDTQRRMVTPRQG